eukprot:3941407-Rhodomonas_salina.9
MLGPPLRLCPREKALLLQAKQAAFKQAASKVSTYSQTLIVRCNDALYYSAPVAVPAAATSRAAFTVSPSWNTSPSRVDLLRGPVVVLH